MQSNKFVFLAAAFSGLLLLSRCYTPQSEGQRLYAQHCASCHMDDGRGLRNLIPPLSGSDYLGKHRDNLACIIRHGQTGEITVNGTVYNNVMPANEELSEVDIINLLNYVQQHFGNNNKIFSPVEVKQALEKCKH